jgi:hypothetical protein
MTVRKERKDENSPPVLNLDRALLEMTKPTFEEEPKEIVLDDGRRFWSTPGLNARIEVIDDHDDGTHDGTVWWERFPLKQAKDSDGEPIEGEWIIGRKGKFGALCLAKYGPNFFEDDSIEFDVDDFHGSRYVSKVIPKENLSTGKVTGTRCHHETIGPVPKPKKKKKNGGGKSVNPKVDAGADLDPETEADDDPPPPF